MSFKDITVNFTRDERLQLTSVQRTLYVMLETRDVMLENDDHLSTGEEFPLCNASQQAFLFLSVLAAHRYGPVEKVNDLCVYISCLRGECSH